MNRSFSRSAALCLAALTAAACGSSTSNGLGDDTSGGNSGSASDDDSGASFQTGGDDGGPGGGFNGGTGSSTGGTDGGGVPVMATSIDRCSTGAPSGLGAATVKLLLAGGSPGSLRYLYPYAQTVFPRGLVSPTLMWDGGSADYVYVHIKSKAFEYKGCLAPTAAGQVQIPEDVWSAASAHTSGATDPFAVSLTLTSAGKITGPITEPLVIAPATLKGTIYYNSYTSHLATGGGGAVLQLVPGKTATEFLGSNGCTGCHAVSANGKRMVAYPIYSAAGGATYALTTTTTTNPAPLVPTAKNTTFVGVYPDGSLYLGNAHPNNGFGGPRAGGPGAMGPVDSALYETDTGNVVANTGISKGAMMPMFSPDGKLLTFNDDAAANLHALATMTFDKASRTATGYKQVYQSSDTSKYPGWPFFLPDDKAIVFALGSAADFSGGGAGLGVGAITGLNGSPTSDLYLLDLASGTSTILAQAMGFATPAKATSNATYLPYGTSEDVHHNYDPTVSPVAAGGYFWMFFDSYRHYGNLGLQRQLWGAAIDVSSTGKYSVDPSHPAFYVTGQELGTGNHRAFTALDACHGDGSSCESGVDCCGGFCTTGKCGVPAPRCSETDEMCKTAADCCDKNLSCIGGFCALNVQ